MNIYNKISSAVILYGLSLFATIPAGWAQAEPGVTTQRHERQERNHASMENTEGRRLWQRKLSGGPWSPHYLDALFAIAQDQRNIFLRKLRLAASTLKGSIKHGLPAPLPAPEPVWVNLGPTDGGMAADVTISDSPYFRKTIASTDSGRVSQIAAEPGVPGTLYVASSEGGLWRTIDSGRSWCSLTEIDTFPSLSLGAVTLDPSVNPTAIYLGLGDVQQQSFGGTGRGIVKSVDGGKTWTPTPVLLGDSRAVPSILVHPKMPNVVLAGTDKGLFRSEDAGKSFSPVELPNDLSSDVTTVRDLNWIEGSQIILTVGRNFTQEPGGGADALVSTDDGLTWQHAVGLGDGEASRISLAVAKSRPQTVYALAADRQGFFLDIFKSEDGGRTWEGTNAFQIRYKTADFTDETPDSLFNPRDAVPPAPQGIYDQVAIVDPANPEVAYFGGVTNLIKTEDGGLSYNVVSDWLLQGDLPYIHPDLQTATFDAGGNLWIGDDGGLARSADGGKSWSTEENKNLTTHLVYSISEGPGDVIVAGLQDNGTRVRGGSSTAFPERLMADGFDTLVHPNNPGLMLGSIYNAWIFRSDNGGISMQASWQDIEDDDHKDAPFLHSYRSFPGGSLEQYGLHLRQKESFQIYRLRF